ncbi:HEPN domain-containing protein [Pedobacter antarcticus]|uniref:HEPN domain-containing protein n=1 Tax=Pedobacter antarcticus TaxID=34086 RepID=UPI00292F5D78|nr:HEPN domain-containing protein [Pedobacter antarcticus]
MKEAMMISNNTYAKEFKNLILLIAEKYQPYQIISFAEKTRLEQAESCFRNNESEQSFDCCLLIITQNTRRVVHDLQEFCNMHFEFGDITTICHGKQAIQEAVFSQNRFFTTVLKTGKVLYSVDGMAVADFILPDELPRNLEATEMQFEKRYALADAFLSGAEVCLNNGQYAICTFLLHQVVEQCCITMITLFMQYRSDIHHLHRLLKLCRCFSDDPYNHYLSSGGERKKLFEILTRSYSRARYSETFSVKKEDAIQLYKLGINFTTLTRKLCRKKIEALTTEFTIAQC